MSRAGRKQKPTMMPPPKPASVQRVEAIVDEGTQMKRELIFYRCKLQARGKELLLPEVWGAMYADWILDQIQRQLEERSKIVIPEPGMLVAQ
jgi:hypothetical protein